MRVLYLLVFIAVLFCVSYAQRRRCRGCWDRKRKICYKENDTWDKTKKYKNGLEQQKTYTCERRGRRYKATSQVVGCRLNGVMYQVGDHFILPGKRCKIYLCSKKIKRIGTGCRKDKKCYDIGDTWETLGEGAKFRFSAECVATKSRRGRKGKFTDIKAECKSDNGTWMGDGDKWEGDNCSEYSCDVTRARRTVSAKLGSTVTGCKFGNDCKDNGEVWDTPDCNTQKCTVTKNSASVDVYKYGCKIDGSCKDEGETWPDGCLTLVCKHNTTHSFPEIQTKRCEFNNGCKDEGETYKDGCLTRVCEFEGNNWRNAIQTNRCDLGNGDCKNDGDTWEVNCVKKTCVVVNTTRTTVKNEIKCKLDNGSCAAVGKTWKKGCETRICKTNPSDDSEVLNVLHKLECNGPNGSCVPDGDWWIDKDRCGNFTCQIQGNMATEDINETFCKDVQDDDCARNGEQVVMKAGDGSLLDCTCKTEPGSNQAKGINCKKL